MLRGCKVKINFSYPWETSLPKNRVITTYGREEKWREVKSQWHHMGPAEAKQDLPLDFPVDEKIPFCWLSQYGQYFLSLITKISSWCTYSDILIQVHLADQCPNLVSTHLIPNLSSLSPTGQDKMSHFHPLCAFLKRTELWKRFHMKKVEVEIKKEESQSGAPGIRNTWKPTRVNWPYNEVCQQVERVTGNWVQAVSLSHWIMILKIFLTWDQNWS